jgi:hypothetical protein
MKSIAANTEHRWTIEEKTCYILSAMAGCLITALLEAQRHYPEDNSGNVVDHSDISRRYYPETYDEVFDEAKYHKTKYKKTKEDSLELKEWIKFSTLENKFFNEN